MPDGHSPEAEERGRYTPEKGELICDHLARGKTLSRLLQRDTKRQWPTRRQIELWREANPDFKAAYSAARKAGFDAIAEGTLRIADGADGLADDDGDEADARGTDDVSRDRLRVDTRFKLLSKWDPSSYGDKVGVEHSGAVDTGLHAWLVAAEGAKAKTDDT